MADFGGDYSGDYGGDISGPGISADSSSGFGFSGPGYDSFGSSDFGSSGVGFSDGSGLQDLGGVFGGDLGSSLVGMDTGMGVDYGLSSMLGYSPEGFSFGSQSGPLGTPSSYGSFGTQSFSNMAPDEQDRLSKLMQILPGIARAVQAAKMTGINIPGPIGALISMGSLGVKSSQGGRPAGGAWGGLAGSVLGGVLGGPVGALAGGWAGSQLGQNALGGVQGVNATSALGNGPGAGGRGMGDLGALLGLGAMLYQNRATNKDLSGQISGLQGLYGPNSAYAQQLRLNLARQDAARGRSRDFSGREVQLQAALADAASRQAPTLAGLYQQKADNRNKLLAGGLYAAQQTNALPRFSNWIGGLSDFYGGGGFGSGSDYGYEDLGQYF